MSLSLSGRGWKVIILIFLIAIIAGGTVIWARFPHDQPVEISLVSNTEFSSQIYINGAVNNPGFYDLKTGDTINVLLQAAGGPTTYADIDKLTLHIPQTDENESSQKVDINHAESWLLEALPGIGETLAGRIIEYREQNGLFRTINELTLVKGISLSAYEKIKSLVTVG